MFPIDVIDNDRSGSGSGPLWAASVARGMRPSYRGAWLGDEIVRSMGVIDRPSDRHRRRGRGRGMVTMMLMVDGRRCPASANMDIEVLVLGVVAAHGCGG